MLPVSWGPSTTWSMWRSPTSRCLMPCRWTLWSVQTHQVSSEPHWCKLYQYWMKLETVYCCVFADLSSSPPGPYGQEQYVFRPEEHLKAPPILPPHLLQVILNKDTNISVSAVHAFTLMIVVTTVTSSWPSVLSLQCDPALLPEPNHVMLNHLYALSIKVHGYTPCGSIVIYYICLLTLNFLLQDGVMVLSATHRYKKKYVTSLLYKPI